MSKELEILKRKLERTLLARKEAEKLLEKKSLELYDSNEELKELNNKLEILVEERTKELKSNEKYLKKLNQFATSVLKQNTINEIVWEVIRLVIKDLGFEDCVIYLLDEDKENLVQRAAFGSKQLDGETIKNPILIPLGKGIVGTVAITGLPELIADTSQDPRYILDDQMRFSELAVPILADGEVIGVIDTEHPEKDFYKQEHLEKLETISGLVSSRMKNAISQEILLSAQVSLKKLSTAVEQSPLSIFITDTGGIIEFVNPAFTETTGYSAEESIGKNSNILKSGKQTQKLYADLWKTIKEGKKWEGEIVNKRKNGELIWVINSISPIKDNNEQIINYVAIQADISAQKKLENELIKSKENAEKASKAKSEFLANMSHEIRTPMNAVLGISEALYYKLDSSQHQKMLGSVLSSGKLLLSLLNDILDLSKIEAGMLELSPHPTNLIGVVEEIKLLYNEKVKTEKVDINIFTSGNFPASIILDELRIKQVIFNLVGNAVKFTHKGYVNIGLDYSTTKNKLGELIITIEDSGIGIPEAQQKLIFQPFKQAELSGGRFGGAGLGLSISQRLIKKMNGVIEVNSKEGKGSVFTVRLPDIETPSSSVEQKNPVLEMMDIIFETADIMIVDDVYSNIETVESLLSSYKLKIIPAESGERALEILNHHKPDLILLDIQMPGLSGFEVAKKIKSNSALRHIPLIGYSASLFSSEKNNKTNDFDGFLFKPVNRSELVSKLAQFLKHKWQDVKVIVDSGKIIQPDSIDGSIIHSLPEIVQLLNDDFLPRWESIESQLVLFKIEEFAGDLLSFAIEYKFQYLIDYANKLIDELEIIDLEAIQTSLQSFPIIIQELRSYLK